MREWVQILRCINIIQNNWAAKLFISSLFSLKQEVIEKYESYRDLVEVLPACQLEVQLYQKKMERQGANVETLANVLSEVCVIQIISN